MPVKRFDIGRIDGPTVSSQGFLKGSAYATRSGVFIYMMMDGTIRRELRHPDDVFDAASMQTLAQVPITNDHPPEIVTPDNAKKYISGFTGESVSRKDYLMQVGIVLTDSEAIKDVLDGKQETSCGYFTDIVDESGTYDGEEYDVRQTNIRYNHLAIVQAGRAGPEVRIKMDEGAGVMVNDEKKSGTKKENPVIFHKTHKKEDIKMAKFTIDNVEYEVTDSALAQVIAGKMDALKTSAEKVAKAETDLQAATAKADVLNSEIKKRDDEIAELKKNTLTEKQIIEKADALVKVRESAKAILGDTVNIDAMDIQAIKKEVVKKSLPKINVDEKDENYINVSFDAILEIGTKSAGDPLKEELGKRVDGETVHDSNAAYAKQKEFAKNQWKPKAA